MSELPSQLGYRWSAEWEPHASTWLSWPKNPATWPGKFETVPSEFAKFVRALAGFEAVNILAGGDAVMQQARELVGGAPNVTLHDIETNDAWCRDHGPTFLVRGHGSQQSALIDWEYNAWGGKYPPFDKDNEVPRQIAELQRRRRFRPGIILEGGAIDGNGLGTVLTTKSCLLNPNRNSHLMQPDVERYLRDFLGVNKVLWLTGGEIAGDDTDGHIDQIARFVGPRMVVVSMCEDPADDNYAPTRLNWNELSQMTDQDGQPLSLVPLPLPAAKYVDGQRLPCGYCNFVFANGGVIVPQFEDPADAQAIKILQELLPDRRVVGSPSLSLTWGLGSFHCLSQQEPA
ncbi:MAG: agmatine deiminase family protein [Planctomycetales bacterium]|nr:agmatine deiminase family protein [Planctomycetales bacterium]